MKPQVIESDKNPRFKNLLALLSSQGIQESSLALNFGAKSNHEILTTNPESVVGLVVKEGLDTEGVGDTHVLSKKLFKELDIFGTDEPVLIVRVPHFESLSVGSPLLGCSLYVPFQDPGNVGATLRSAAAFGVNQILLGSMVAHPFHPRSSRAASGTLYKHRYFKIQEKDLGNLNIPKVGLDLKGESLGSFHFPKDFILIPGEEGPGLRNSSFEFASTISIPLENNVESLNAMVATSIALFAWTTRK